MRQKLDFRDSMTKEELEYRRRQIIEEEPKCPICGEQIESPFRFFCSWECGRVFGREGKAQSD